MAYYYRADEGLMRWEMCRTEYNNLMITWRTFIGKQMTIDDDSSLFIDLIKR